MKAPRRGLPSPPRLELSGSEPSHEPRSRSVNSAKKSTPRQQASRKRAIAATAKPRVFVEGMREQVSANASDGALLQREMPAEGEAVVAMEKPAAVAAIGKRSQDTAATEYPSSRTAATVWTCTVTPERGARGSSQGASAKTFFLATRVTVRAAINASNEHGGRRCNDSARMVAGARWNAYWSAKGDGGNAVKHASREPRAWPPDPRHCGYEAIENVPIYCRDQNIFLDSVRPQQRKGEPGRLFWLFWFLSSPIRREPCCAGLKSNRRN